MGDASSPTTTSPTISGRSTSAATSGTSAASPSTIASGGASGVASGTSAEHPSPEQTSPAPEPDDEHDAIEKDFEEIDGELRIEGGVPLWEVNEKLQAHLPEEEYDTLGGFVFGALGRMPRSGDLLEFEELKFRVLRMDGRRVGRVSVRRLESPDAPAEKSGAAAN